jgi:hypothetical protein
MCETRQAIYEQKEILSLISSQDEIKHHHQRSKVLCREAYCHEELEQEQSDMVGKLGWQRYGREVRSISRYREPCANNGPSVTSE